MVVEDQRVRNIPQGSWTTGKGGSPTAGPREIVNGWGGPGERRCPGVSRWSVPHEIHRLQRAAVAKCRPINVPDAAGQGNGGEVDADIESSEANVVHAAWDGDVGETEAAREGIVSD